MFNTITNRQMAFIFVLMLTSYSVVIIPKYMATSAGTGAWVVLLVTSIVFGLFSMVIVSLNNMFHGKTLFEYSAQLITKPGAYLITIVYILYFFSIIVILVSQQAQLLKSNFFIKTPDFVFPLLGILLYCYIAAKGITTMARLCEMIGIVFVVTAVSVHTIMLFEGHILRILPLFNPDDLGDYAEGFTKAVTPFLPISLLFAIPFTQKNKTAKKPAFFTLVGIGLFYILVVYTTIMMVGLNDIAHYDDAVIVAIRNVELEFLDFVARMDILYMTVGFAGLFMGISILMTLVTDFLCRMFKSVKRMAIVIALGILTLASFFVVRGLEGFGQFADEAETVIGVVLCLIVPTALLIIAKLKKRSKKRKSKATAS